MLFDKPKSDRVLSLCFNGEHVYVMQITLKEKQPVVTFFQKIDYVKEKENVKLLYTKEQEEEIEFLAKTSLVVSHLKSEDVLTRFVTLPITKKKDLLEALPFQIESKLPFSLDETLYDIANISYKEKESLSLIYATRQSVVENTLSLLKNTSLEPEVLTSIPHALFHYYKEFMEHLSEENVIILYVCQVTKDINGLLISHHELTAALSLKMTSSSIAEAAQMVLALLKQSSSGNASFCVVGDAYAKKIEIALAEHLALSIQPIDESTRERALSLGMAIAYLPNRTFPINFRQNNLLYRDPLKHVKKSLLSYIVSASICTTAIFCMTAAWKSKEVKHLSLATHQLGLNDSLEHLSLEEKIIYLEQTLDQQPTYFALTPNIPRVKETLLWLSSNKDFFPLTLESFSYKVVKYPDSTNKKEKYKVRIDIEFTAQSARDARAFHEALLSPNIIVDSRSEVLWQLDRGTYKAAFFLKDKTRYPKI